MIKIIYLWAGFTCYELINERPVPYRQVDKVKCERPGEAISIIRASRDSLEKDSSIWFHNL